ncbi:MAG: acyl-CoA synthetase [Acidimicrobiales bacterium]
MPGSDTTLDSYNLADVWEAVVDRVGDRTAIVCGDRRLTYDELEARANRLAHWLLAQGVQPGQHVGVYLTNAVEYFETMLAAYKVRAVPINVNHRYVADELRHLFSDADVVGIVYHRSFAPRLEAVRGDLPLLRWCLCVEDGSDAPIAELGGIEYEEQLATSSAARRVPPRSDDDPYVIYTGGTTGFPKGVVWRQEDAFFACIGGGDPMRLMGPVSSPPEVLDRIIDGTFVFLPVAPLMHAAGQWTSLSWLYAGGRVVLLPGSLDPIAVWRTIEQEGVNLITIVGDAVARPLIDAWEAEGPFDVSTLLSIGSGGAPLTPALRERLMAIVPGAAIADGFGSSETGAQGGARLEPGQQPSAGVTRFTPYGDTTTVLDEVTLEPVEPGSEAVGRVARRGHIPQGYYKDPAKTAETFVEAAGHRWVLTGDMATVDADGTIQLLGRGSVCINTGGEKVFPEEVEAVLKAHPGVYDAVVVGVPDERWGQRVAAVVQPSAGGAGAAQPDDVVAHCRTALAGYKVPRSVVVVDRIERSPAGKADYRWARAVAEDAGRVS